MALAKEAYQALEDIVGPRNISEEPAILDSYAFQYAAELFRDGKKFMVRPEAALLPGSTEEVQAIVRTCNRYGIKIKPYSTGWAHPTSAPAIEGVITLDLRRMDRILEIDEKNMFAVVEPYVIGATLQAEAMKLGLNTHMIGAGPSCSPLASATSYAGPGPDSISMGLSSENLLAAEWVLPNGDIVRTGTLGSRNGWFCGEGPGPSIRAIIRGVVGAMGGLGVFTKVALKLYPWPGPAVMPIEGVVPAYTAPVPGNFRVHTIAFPDWGSCADACYQIFDNELGYICHRQFPMFGEGLQAAMLRIISDPDKTLEDLEELLKTPEIQKLTEEMRLSFQIVLAGMTSRHIEYQGRVLDKILAETGGHKVAAMEEPTMQKYSFLYMIKLCFKALNFIYNGTFADTCPFNGTPDILKEGLVEFAAELKRRYAGGIVDDGGAALMGGVGALGGGGKVSFEPFIFYDPHDRESVRAAVEVMLEGDKYLAERKMPIGIYTGLSGMAIAEEEKRSVRLASRQEFQWQRKIKEILDPNRVGDGCYLWGKKPEE